MPPKRANAKQAGSQRMEITYMIPARLRLKASQVWVGASVLGGEQNVGLLQRDTNRQAAQVVWKLRQLDTIFFNWSPSGAHLPMRKSFSL